MMPEHERWAEALLVKRLHGERAALHISERIRTLAAAGDVAGVQRWREIAERFDQLQPQSPPVL
jgi:hypothetical protein